MNSDLRERVIVITEADHGVGAACAYLLASHGASVVLGASRIERAQAVARELTWNGFCASARLADSMDHGQVADLVAGAVALHGRIDALVNSPRAWPAGTGSSTDWLGLADQHIQSYVNGIAAASPHMVRQGGGHVVNVAPLDLPGRVAETEVVRRTVRESVMQALAELTRAMRRSRDIDQVRATLVAAGGARHGAQSAARAVHFALCEPGGIVLDMAPGDFAGMAPVSGAAQAAFARPSPDRERAAPCAPSAVS